MIREIVPPMTVKPLRRRRGFRVDIDDGSWDCVPVEPTGLSQKCIEDPELARWAAMECCHKFVDKKGLIRWSLFRSLPLIVERLSEKAIA